MSVLYLFLFLFSELYSALAAAMDNGAHSQSWERALGFGLLLIPSTLLVGVVLLLARRVILGFYLGLVSVSMYAAFFAIESYAARNTPSTASLEASVILYAFWSLAFVLAFAALVGLRRHEQVTKPILPP